MLRHDLARVFNWQRVKVMLVACFVLHLLILMTWQASYAVLVGRVLFIGFLVLTAFGIFEHWPARLPAWTARWAVQVVAVAVAVPIGTVLAYTFTTMGDQPSWWHNQNRMFGFGLMTFMGLMS